MADPLRGTILDELRRDQLHSKDVAAALEFLREALGKEGIPFALVGALSLRHHGYTRFTEDIDILTTREGLERIHECFVGRGLLPRGPGLKKKLRQTQYKVNIDIITAGEHAGSPESPVIFPSPESEAFADRDGLRVVTLEKLIELKLASGIWGNRAKDLGDVQELIKANGLDESFAGKLTAELEARYLELLEKARSERELEE
jgi:hypothetical protein